MGYRLSETQHKIVGALVGAGLAGVAQGNGVKATTALGGLWLDLAVKVLLDRQLDTIEMPLHFQRHVTIEYGTGSLPQAEEFGPA